MCRLLFFFLSFFLFFFILFLVFFLLLLSLLLRSVLVDLLILPFVHSFQAYFSVVILGAFQRSTMYLRDCVLITFYTIFFSFSSLTCFFLLLLLLRVVVLSHSFVWYCLYCCCCIFSFGRFVSRYVSLFFVIFKHTNYEYCMRSFTFFPTRIWFYFFEHPVWSIGFALKYLIFRNGRKSLKSPFKEKRSLEALLGCCVCVYCRTPCGHDVFVGKILWALNK